MNSKSWITDLLAENENVETPTSWIYWSLIFTISSAAANNYTLRSLSGKVIYYPNVYIMLLGESGLGKGYPVNLANRLIQEADITRVISGRSSIQAIIKEASTARSSPGKPVLTDSRAAIINGELSSAIIGDPQALEILTDLFDRNYHNKPWVNLLKGDGAEQLKEPYWTCLFGSSPAHFYNSIPQHNIEGGYIGRNLIIYESKRARDLDLLSADDPEEINTDWFTSVAIPKYVPHLTKIAKHKSRMIPTEGARNLFNNWRREWRANQSVYDDKTGFVNRVPDHVLKVSMCLALARYDNSDCSIIESDVTEAIEKITNLIYASQKTAEGTGIDLTAQQTKKVIDYLIQSPNLSLTRTELAVKGFGNYDVGTLDKIIENLLEMKWITKEKVGVGKNLDYLIHLAGRPLESYMKFKASQNGHLR